MNWKSTIALLVLASAAGVWLWKGDDWSPKIFLSPTVHLYCIIYRNLIAFFTSFHCWSRRLMRKTRLPSSSDRDFFQFSDRLKLTRAEMTFRLTDQLNGERSSHIGGIWRDLIDSENQSIGKIVSGKRVHFSKYHRFKEA